LRRKIKAFTLVEVLFVTLISSFIVAGLIYAMNAGSFSYKVSTAKVNLQSEVRRAIDWIVKDTRQAVSWDIANNNPTHSYLKFRQVTGWDTVNNTFLLSDYYIEYTYNSINNTIVRMKRDLSDNILGTWVLNNVFAPPFFTRDTSGNVVALDNKNDLLTSKQLVITVSGQSQVTNSETITYSLTQEVEIRNG